MLLIIKRIFKKTIPKFLRINSIWAIGIADHKYKEFAIVKSNLLNHYADPFLFRYDEESYVVFEEFDWKSEKAHLMISKISNMVLLKPYILLKEKFDLAFPFIFQSNDNIFMIPDTNKVNKIMLYEIVENKSHFKANFVKILIDDIDAADTIIIENIEGYILLTSIGIDKSNGMNHCDNLKVFYSKDLFECEFIEIHDVSIDSLGYSNANYRNAGSPFEHLGKKYRLSMDSTTSYGGDINLNQIEIMTSNKYSERFVRKIVKPNNLNSSSMHTLNFNSDYVVIDFKYKINSLDYLRYLVARIFLKQ